MRLKIVSEAAMAVELIIVQAAQQDMEEPQSGWSGMSDYERGKRRFTPAMAERIAGVINIKAERIS